MKPPDEILKFYFKGENEDWIELKNPPNYLVEFAKDHPDTYRLFYVKPDGEKYHYYWEEEDLSLEDARKQVLDRFEKEYLVHLLEKYRGKIAACARHAGVTSRSINAKIRKHNLFKEDFKEKL